MFILEIFPNNVYEFPLNIPKEKAEEKAYRLIANSLVTQYKPGDFLYESRLAKELSMSRTPVSIALNALVNEGLLRKHPKKGCMIPKLSIEDAYNVFTTRRALEMEAIRSVIKKKDPSVLENLQNSLDLQAQEVHKDDFDQFYFLDLDFHRTLVESAKNKYILTAWQRVFIRCNIYTGYFMDVFRQHQLIAQTLMHDHAEIFEAIQNDQTELALEKIFTHFDHIAMYAIEFTMIYDIHD